MQVTWLFTLRTKNPDKGERLRKYSPQQSDLSRNESAGRRSGDIPPFVKFASSWLGAGFFPGQYGALLISGPKKGIGSVELSHSGWDHHGGIYSEFGSHATSADRGIAALKSDLKSRGLLDTT